MVLDKIDTRVRIGDQAFRAIRSAIIDGQYEAGARLQINALADELGTSMMPVREAIKRLEEIGLVENRPYRGAVVKEFTTAELLNIYELRHLLEMEATRLGAAQLGPSDVDTLRRIHERVTEAMRDGDAALYNDVDEELLLEVYTKSGNPLLVEFIQNLWARCRYYKLVSTEKELAEGSSKTTTTLNLHSELIDAIAEGDAERAAAVTGRSIAAASVRVQEKFNSAPSN